MNSSIYGTSESIINAQLRDGEQLLWTGQPRKGVMLRPTDVFMIPFSLMWGGFAFFWEFTVLRSPSPLLMKLWGIPFCLVGIYIIFGRFFFEARQRDTTHYGVTSERILIVSGNGKQIKSITLRNLPQINLNLKGDGTGSIVFGDQTVANMMQTGFSTNRNNAGAVPTFEMIPDVRQVHDLIIDAQSKTH